MYQLIHPLFLWSTWITLFNRTQFMNNYDVLTGRINNIGPVSPQRYIANTPNRMITATVLKAGAMLIANVMAPGGTTTATVRQFGNTTLFDIF